MSRSNRREIQAYKISTKGPTLVPPLILLAQRHYEKDPPVRDGTDATLTVPLDLLRLLKVPNFLLNDIEEITITYHKR